MSIENYPPRLRKLLLILSDGEPKVDKHLMESCEIRTHVYLRLCVSSLRRKFEKMNKSITIISVHNEDFGTIYKLIKFKKASIKDI